MSLFSLSPIDGRYRKITEPLSKFFSEQALMRHRLIVEGEYFIALSENADIHADQRRGSKRGVRGSIRKLSDKEKKLIRSLYNLSEKDAQIISQIETKGYKGIKATDHDVKAVEYYMKDKLASTSLKDVLEWVHFALTSEDINNLAYALMLKSSLNNILIPKLEQIIQSLNHLIFKSASLPMLARTHGQPASPTTFGKEFKVFAARLERQSDILKNMRILCKLNGATGNYNAHVAAFPKIDWIKFFQKFIVSLNSLPLACLSGRRVGRAGEGMKNLSTKYLALSTNLFTTQIEPHDSYIETFDCLRRINSILIDFNQDLWRYISDEWIVQKPQAGAVGSSTMPHKINPIKFENSEGNLGVANAFFEFFARKLPISRLQRDLSDSTVERNFGVALAHCLVAYEYLLKGLSRIAVDKNKVREDLNRHPEVIAEAIQTILRREGIPMPYEQLKALTRGKKVTLADLHKFIDGLDISNQVKKELKKLTPLNYIGLAAKLASL
jgi:adenylosuccinate lyase